MKLSPLVRSVLLLYDVAVEVVVLLVLVPVGLVRAAVGLGSLEELAQRLGSAPRVESAATLTGGDPGSAATRRLVWIHAVSVGELAAAEALLDVGEARGGWLDGERLGGKTRVVLSTGTREGLRFARRLAARHRSVVGVRLLPWDRRRVLRRVLRRVEGAGAPAVMVVVETELWPGLLAVCGELGIAVEMVSVRIPPQEVWRYRLGRWFFGPLLGTVAGIGAQSERERRRLVSIGAPAERVAVEGNLKADRLPSARSPERSASKSRTARAPVVLGASTHRADERALLAACAELVRRGFDLRVVIAPRHPSRAAAVARRARSLGRVEVGPSPSFLSAEGAELVTEPQSSSRVAVIDRLGVLDELYDACDVVVVGGAFGRRGGHDPLAPASRARPVIVGPRHRHVEHAVEALRSSGGLWIARDDRELTDRLAELLSDEEARRQSGAAGARAVDSMRGAAERAAERLKRRLCSHTSRSGVSRSGVSRSGVSSTASSSPRPRGRSRS